MKDLRADHIDNIGKYLDRTDMTTFEATLGKYTIAMYCEKANLQRACLNCHKIKTKEERKK